MKTTMIARSIANPQRTTLAHLQDGAELTPAPRPRSAAQPFPVRTANPRRTVLTDEPPA